MKENLTEIVFVIDRSGSMCGLEDDTIGGFNSMLAKQQKEPGEAYLSCVLFNGSSEVIYDRVAIKDIKEMTEQEYRVGGSTALLDAVGGAIHHIGNVHKYARREDVPNKTLFVIITDGYENSSCRYSYSEIKRMITRQQEKYGWEFIFLGANIDAVAEAGRFGIREDRAVQYENDSEGVRKNYECVNMCMAQLRMDKEIDDNCFEAAREHYRKSRG